MRLSAPRLIILTMSVLPITGSPVDEISPLVTQAAKGATAAEVLILKRTPKTRSCEKNQRRSSLAPERLCRGDFPYGARSCALILSVVIKVSCSPGT
jgi:hypothetical protein